MNISRRVRAASAAFVLALAVAACGGDDDAAETSPAGSSPPASDAPPAPATDPVPVTDADPAAAAFPVTIEHKFGETTIEAKPERVVSVGFAEHEGLLAIGVEPVGVRDWYGDQPYATWPWAQDELGDLQPDVIPSDGLNFEQIAALRPDLILGVSSGMTDSDYATLSAIAPTIAQPGDYVEYGTPWDVMLEIHARATGHSDVAAQVIADTRARFAEVRAAHPDWEGLTVGVTYLYDNQPGGYASDDARARLLGEIGLTTPAAYDEIAGDQFWFVVSAEEVAQLDADALVWLGDGDAAVQAIRDLPLRTSLDAYREGREIVADPLLAGAFSHGSPLSFDYVLEHLVPELELALDGDPATVVPSAAAIDPAGEAPTVGGDE